MTRSLVPALAFVLAALPSLASARPRVAVPKFSGDPGGQVHDAVDDALQDAFSLVSKRDIDHSEDRLGLDTKLSNHDLEKLSRDLDVDAIIQGEVSRRHGHHLLHVRLFVHGKVVRGFKVEFASLHSKKFKSALRDKMVEKIGDDSGGDGGDRDARRDDRGDRDNRDAHDDRGDRDNRDTHDDRGDRDNRDAHDDRGDRDARDDHGDRDRRDDGGDRDPRDDHGDAHDDRGDRDAHSDDADHRDDHGDRGNDGSGDDRGRDDRDARDDRGRDDHGNDGDRDDRHGRGDRRTADRDGDRDGDDPNSVSAHASPLGREPAHAANRAAIRVDLGISATTRQLHFVSRSFTGGLGPPPGYHNSAVPSVGVDGELYPFAFSDPRSAAAGIGLAGSFEQVASLAVQNSQQPGMRFPVLERHWTIGARYRLVIGGKSTSPSITFGVDYGHREFQINQKGLMDGLIIDVPNVDYKGITPNVQFRIPFGRTIALVFGGGSTLMLGVGAIGYSDQYGRARVTEGEGMAGLDFVFGNRYALRILAEAAQVGYVFEGTGELTTSRDGNPASPDVGGASDRFISGGATFGILY